MDFHVPAILVFEVKVKMIKGIRVLILAILIVSSCCICMAFSYADTDGMASVDVYVTISNNSDFVQGNDGTVMAHVPVKVEYFDLADYGLEDYYRYDDDDELIEEPTVLHLLIRVLEKYYAMRKLDREGDMHSNIINVAGAPRSLWLSRFWGHDGNLMYFINHAYPIMYGTNGATADYILLSDGDDVDLAMYTDWGFYTKSAFLYFDQSTMEVNREEQIGLQLLAKPTSVVNDGVDPGGFPMADELIRVSSDKGITWKTLEQKTDSEGHISLSFDSSGIYYIATGPTHVNYKDAAPAICVIEVSELTKDEELLERSKQTAITDLQNYKSPDLYREAEQSELASIVENGVDAIKAAKTTEEVQTAYNDAVSRIDALKTKAQYEAEEQGQGGEQDDPAAKVLAETKANAKAELAAYKDSKNLDLYRDEQQEELAQIVEHGIMAIDAAQTVDKVVQILADSKVEIDAVKTDEQMTQEESETEEEQAQRLLGEAKVNAKMELDLYMTPSEYREAEKVLLLDLLTEGESAIDAAETEEAVKALLREYKGKIDQLKTDAQYEAEEEAARREEAERKAKEKAAAIKKAKAAKTTVKVTALKKHKAKISWKKVTLSYKAAGETGKFNVTGYKIYRASKKNGKYKLIKTIKKAGTLKYTDKKIKKGKKYFYKVRTYTKINGKKYNGKWSAVKMVKGK